MKYAFLNDGRRVDLANYIAVRNQAGSKLKAFCPSCNAPVHPNRSLAAEGFTATRKEVTTRVSSQKRKPVPGFSHYKFGAGKNCKQSYVDNPDFTGRPIDEEYFTSVRLKNQAVYNDLKMKRSIKFMQDYLMHRLTGIPTLSADDENQMGLLAHRLMETPGLHQYPWLLPYMQVLLIGNRERTFQTGWQAAAVYQSRGEQKLEFTDIDGEKRTMTVPATIVLSRVSRNPKAATVTSLKSRRSMQGTERLSEIFFRVRRADAHDMVVQGLKRELRVRALASPTRRGPKQHVHPGQLRLL